MKTLDIRVVVADQISNEDAVFSVANSDTRILGAAMLQNDGFGHSLATGPSVIISGGAQSSQVERKLSHPDTNWKDGTKS